MNHNLFTGQLVRLAALNPEKDAEAIARWSRDTEFQRLADSDPAYPKSVKDTRQWLEEWSSASDGFRFAIRTLADDRLIGFIGLGGVQWSQGDSWVGISIGERDYWGRGYGTDAMQVILRYAFTELNLQRVSLEASADNPRAIRSYEKAGFVLEGRQRERERRDGRYGDSIFMGILQEEWLQTVTNDKW
jgi:RimJ/RimL family protein N-acetyltransferase